ncbi:MAG: amino acid adenylation domain-containing protein [Polyangiaceae bacterium]
MSDSNDLALRRARLSPEQRALLQRRLSGGQTAATVSAIPRRALGSPAPLSHAQQRLWFLWQLNPSDCAYHLHGGLELSGAVDVPALRASLSTVVARHEALRTVFAADSTGLATATVMPKVAVELPCLDFSAFEPAERAACLKSLEEQLVQSPFDLTTGPLLRASLIRLAEREHRLLVALHHIVADAWSVEIILSDLSQTYRAATLGVSVEFRELCIGYGDYAEWQRSWLEAGAGARQLAYWKERLAGEQPALTLPVDHARSLGAGAAAATHGFALPAELVEAARADARARNGTLFTTFLTTLQALLFRYSGQADVRIGVPFANRSRSETQGVVGFFVSTQVLRAEVTARTQLGVLWQSTRDAGLAAQENQEVPFEQLVQALQPERRPQLNPLFQAMFNHLRWDSRSLAAWPGLEVKRYDWPEVGAQVELSLETIETDSEVLVRWHYARDLFEPSTIARLAAHFVTLLRQVVTQPERCVGDAELLAEGERRELDRWGVNQRPFSEIMPLPRWFEQRAAATPDAIALEFGGEQLSYEALNTRANRLAHRLIALGVGPESKLGVALERGVDLVVALLATLKAGASYVPLDPEYPRERLDFMLRDSHVALLLTQRRALERLGEPAVPRLLLDEIGLEQGAASDPNVGVHGENLAYTIYTSGSTGRPKGVMVTHQALSHFLLSMREQPGLTASDCVAAVTSLSFDIAALELYLPLVCGAKVLLLPRDVSRDGEALAQVLGDRRVTVLQSTPASWRLLSAEPRILASLPPLKGLVGGEALPADLAQLLLAQRIELWNMYGPTETTIWSSANRVQGAPHIGGPIPGTRLLVLDGELNLVPQGATGELYIGGVGLARGYLGRPELTAQRFVADPFEPGARLYRTGDLVRFRAEQELEYVGRVDHQIKLRGHRIELGEIEEQLRSHPSVGDAVAVVKQGGAGARLLAYVVERTSHVLDVADLREGLRRSLPEYMLPSSIVVLAALPLTPSGKVDRGALPDVAAEADANVVEPRGQFELIVAGIWRELLGVQQVGRSQSFFELGGHSLLALQMISRLRAEHGLVLPLKSVFDAPRLSDLALRLEQGAVRSAPLLPLAPASSFRLSPTQRRLWLVERVGASGAGERAAYNMATSLRLEGELDVESLREALSAVVARHQPLHTLFGENDDGDPVALLQPVQRVAMELRDAVETELQSELMAFSAPGFDLAQGPLLRACLLRFAPRRHALLLCVHHIAFDGWSESIFARELLELYRAARASEPAKLSALAIQYADYADWQSRRLEAESQKYAGFWREYLAAAPSTSRVEPELAPSTPFDSAAEVVQVVVPTALRERLSGFALEQRLSLFTTLFAAFALTLHGRGRSNDLVIGTDVAGRDELELEQLIGFFVNVVPLRSRLRVGVSLGDWLAELQQSTLAALEHSQLPFDEIVERAGAPRSRAHTPLVQVLFVLHNVPEAHFELPGLSIDVAPQPIATTKFDLAVFVRADAHGLRADWSYRAALYRRKTIESVGSAWLEALRQMVSSAELPVERFLGISNEEPNVSSIPASKASKLDKLKRVVSKPAATASAEPAHYGSLPGHARFPLVVEASSRDLDPIAWAHQQRHAIDAQLLEHGGILFRNFALRTPQDFETFAEALEPELYGTYGDLPKKQGGKKTYQSTPYPEKQMILFHNESSHLSRWPRKQWFYCELPAVTGGATPIVDCREMLRRLPAELVSELERKQLLYVRTFHSRIDVSWQDFFKTDSRAEVEATLARDGVQWSWLDGDTLQTRTRCPAVITHPLTGARSFFNQVQLHHVSCLDAEIRNDLLETVGPDQLPRHVYYGDGTPIDDETMGIIGRAYEACAVRFAWRRGDVVMLDNMLAAHARDPYTGPRTIVVAMGAMFERNALREASRFAALSAGSLHEASR